MFWFNLLCLIIPFVVYRLAKEIKLIYDLQQYKKQGVKSVFYQPWIYKIWTIAQNSKKSDFWKSLRALYTKANKEGGDLMITNSVRTNNVYVSFLSDKAVREFFRKETEVSVKFTPFATVDIFSFFFKSGKKVTDDRAIFGKVFRYDNIMNLIPMIKEIIREHVQKLKTRVEAEPSKKLFLDLKEECFVQMFEDITSMFLLGQRNNKVEATFNGKNISALVKSMFQDYVKSQLNPLNTPFFERLGLVSQINRIKKEKAGLENIIIGEYKKRFANFNDKKGETTSVLDIIIKHNLEAQEKGTGDEYSLKQIADWFSLFHFAAGDTSFHGSSSALVYLSYLKHQPLQDKLRKEVQGLREEYNGEEVMSLRYLSMVVDETLRISGPASIITERVAIKDFTICGKKIKKGHSMSLFLPGLGMDEQYFPEPMKFDPERFSPEKKKNIPNMKHIPFSSGRRGCIGKYLGEVLVKSIVAEFLKVFKFEVKKDYKMILQMKPIYGVGNPNVFVSLAKQN